jgi:hypothetical protein
MIAVEHDALWRNSDDGPGPGGQEHDHVQMVLEAVAIVMTGNMNSRVNERLAVKHLPEIVVQGIDHVLRTLVGAKIDRDEMRVE